jgi:hypothetical protein
MTWEGPAPRVLLGEGVPRAIKNEYEMVINAALNHEANIDIRVT